MHAVPPSLTELRKSLAAVKACIKEDKLLMEEALAGGKQPEPSLKANLARASGSQPAAPGRGGLAGGAGAAGICLGGRPAAGGAGLAGWPAAGGAGRGLLFLCGLAGPVNPSCAR